MTIDFHVHGKISKNIPFDEKEFLNKVNEAKNSGIDALALTEHIDAKNFSECYDYLARNYSYSSDFYNVDGVKIFIGTEISTEEKFDVLVIKDRDYIFSLKNNKKIEKPAGDNKKISINDLFDIITKDSLNILAHPYRKCENFPDLDSKIFRKLDAIELNANDLYKQGIENMKNKIEILSKKLNLPITGGSDSHHFIQIGSIKNNFSQNCDTIQDIKIKLKNHKIEISNELPIRVRCQKIIKNIVKS